MRFGAAIGRGATFAAAIGSACTFNSTTIVVQGETDATGNTTEASAVDSETSAGMGSTVAAGTSMSDAGDTSQGGSPGTSSGGGEDEGDSTTGCTPTAWFPDADQDGFGDPKGPAIMACAACAGSAGHVDNADDCDDDNDAVSPGLDETCDGIDNDCDLAIDEWSVANVTCAGCTAEVDGGSVYYFCSGSMTWDAALAQCAPKGATLVRIDSMPENTFVDTGVAARTPGDVWIGLRRVARALQWTDGVVPTFTAWRPGAPDFSGDCTELDSLDAGQWNDVDCSDSGTTVAYVCEGPA